MRPSLTLNCRIGCNLNASPTTLPMAATPVTAAANFAKQKLTIGPINIPAPGYVYIYVNNNSDTPNWLHFDDLKVTQTHSPFVAGGDFYPFGLTMEDRQIKAERYRYGYQGQYAEKDSLTNLNQFDKRLYDPEFGVWTSMDPEGQFYSPYVGMGNNPVSAVDADGGYIFFANNIKNQKGLFKSLNKYYSTAGGKMRIDKFINDPHKHWFIKVEQTATVNSKTGSGKAGARTGERPQVAARYANINQSYPVNPGDLYSETTVNGYDFALGSAISTESIGHDFEAHVFNPIVNYPLLNSGGQHLLFGGTHALTNDPAAQATAFGRAKELYQQLQAVTPKQSKKQNFTSIATAAVTFSRLVFKPTVVRQPRYRPSRLSIK